MRKYFLFIIGLAVICQMVAFGAPKVYGEVVIQVVDEQGNALDWTYFDAAFYTPPGDRFEVMTDENGSFTVDDQYVGDKISISSYSMLQDGAKSRWTSVSADGSKITCFKESPPLM